MAKFAKVRVRPYSCVFSEGVEDPEGSEKVVREALVLIGLRAAKRAVKASFILFSNAE
jgi:hypothetical protein